MQVLQIQQAALRATLAVVCALEGASQWLHQTSLGRNHKQLFLPFSMNLYIFPCFAKILLC